MAKNSEMDADEKAERGRFALKKESIGRVRLARPVWIAFARRRMPDDPGAPRVAMRKIWRGASIRRRAAPC